MANVNYQALFMLWQFVALFSHTFFIDGVCNKFVTNNFVSFSNAFFVLGNLVLWVCDKHFSAHLRRRRQVHHVQNGRSNITQLARL